METLMNESSKHLDKQDTRARILFTDFSSVLNIIQPHVLLDKLIDMMNCFLLKMDFLLF